MSDVSKTNDRMSEVRLAIMETLNDPVMTLVYNRDLDAWSAGLAMKLCNETLADALASRAVQGEPNDDRGFLVDLIREHDLAADENTSPRDYRAGLALGILAAGFSRATVPDAALAAISRGRLHDAVNAIPNHVWDAVNEIADTEGFTDALLAALDGAPEPEVKP